MDIPNSMFANLWKWLFDSWMHNGCSLLIDGLIIALPTLDVGQTVPESTFSQKQRFKMAHQAFACISEIIEPQIGMQHEVGIGMEQYAGPTDASVKCPACRGL